MVTLTVTTNTETIPKSDENTSSNMVTLTLNTETIPQSDSPSIALALSGVGGALATLFIVALVGGILAVIWKGYVVHSRMKNLESDRSQTVTTSTNGMEMLNFSSGFENQEVSSIDASL